MRLFMSREVTKKVKAKRTNDEMEWNSGEGNQVCAVVWNILADIITDIYMTV